MLLLSLSLRSNAQTWTQLSDLPGTARDDAASFAMNGKIYVGTGREVGFGYTNDWFAFDEAEGTWSSIAPLPASGRQYCTTFTDGTYCYLFGGTNDNGPLNEMWRYDPVYDLWEEREPLPGPGRYACASMQAGHIVGGLLAGGIATNEHWYYHPALDQWSTRAALPGPGRHRAAAGDGWLMGGANEAYEALSDGYVFNGGDPGVWEAMEDLPNALYSADGSGQVIIGGASDDMVLHSDVWYHHLSSWIGLNSFPGGERRGGAIAGSSGPDGQAWVYFGTGTDLTQRHNDWWRLSYDPSAIQEPDRTLEFTLFPVPANTAFWITVHPSAIGAELMIRTVDGRVIEQRRIREAHFAVDANAFANGSYSIQLSTTSGTTVRRTVIMH